jgi:hypothetical protein
MRFMVWTGLFVHAIGGHVHAHAHAGSGFEIGAGGVSPVGK